MATISLILLTFFVSVGKFKPAGAMQVNLPLSSPVPSRVCSMQPAFEITMPGDGNMYVWEGGAFVSSGYQHVRNPADLIARMKAVVASQKGTRFFVKADAELPYWKMQELFKAFEAAEIYRYSLVTYRDVSRIPNQ